MITPSILDHICLRHAPLHAADGRLLALRLDWDALSGQSRPGVEALLAALPTTSRAWVLPLAEADDLEVVAATGLPKGSFVEFDAAWASTAAAKSLPALASAGVRLISRGRLPSSSPLAAQISLCVDTVGHRQLHTRVQSLQQMEHAFAQGAAAVLGWPVHNDIVPTAGNGEADVKLVLEILSRIDRGDPVARIEPLLDRSPTLSFRLMGFLNSAACGLRTEATSMRHAIMMMGYNKLRQWVALLLASAVETPRTRPLMQASLRRGFLMQEIAACLGHPEAHGDMFICGMFSLLDQMLGKPMAALLADMPLSREVLDCLGPGQGPLAPYLSLARQLEGGDVFDLPAACEATATTPAEVNRSVLSALDRAFAVS
jgi:c-di-GMP phosphodiesterase